MKRHPGYAIAQQVGDTIAALVAVFMLAVWLQQLAEWYLWTW